MIEITLCDDCRSCKHCVDAKFSIGSDYIPLPICEINNSVCVNKEKCDITREMYDEYKRKSEIFCDEIMDIIKEIIL